MDTLLRPAPPPSAPADLFLVILGPAALGLAASLGGDLDGLASAVITLPAVVLGTTVFMLPALYIGSALVGADAGAREMGRHALAALREAGMGCLGLAPAMMFLCATSTLGGGLAVQLALLFAMILGLRGLHARLFAEHEGFFASLVFTAWAAVAVGIGSQLAGPVL